MDPLNRNFYIVGSHTEEQTGTELTKIRQKIRIGRVEHTIVLLVKNSELETIKSLPPSKMKSELKQMIEAEVYKIMTKGGAQKRLGDVISHVGPSAVQKAPDRPESEILQELRILKEMSSNTASEIKKHENDLKVINALIDSESDIIKHYEKPPLVYTSGLEEHRLIFEDLKAQKATLDGLLKNSLESAKSLKANIDTTLQKYNGSYGFDKADNPIKVDKLAHHPISDGKVSKVTTSFRKRVKANDPQLQ
jgi:hypothetical protein